MSTDALPPAPAAIPTRSSWLTTLGWAAYLACSWTWCIGMFLPVLLVRDFGIWGFVVFAVPNVIGAGAMGWVLRDGASERIVERHRIACTAFSIVTIAFQVYFAGWFLFRLNRTAGYDGQYPLVVGLTMATSLFVALAWGLLQYARGTGRVLLSILAIGVSAAAGITLLREGILDAWNDAELRALIGRHVPGLPWMAPVCVFGFVLCPYLDLTFLRARSAQSGMGARASFSLGFGVFFASMILLTLAYAPVSLGLMGYPVSKTAAFAIVVPLAAHLFIQLATTMALHADELLVLPQPMRRRSVAVLLVALILVAAVCSEIDWQVVGRLEMLLGEVIYRGFMSFYGLVFPAYVWLCVIPTRDGHSGPSRGKVLVWAIAVLVAAPMFWMGFIERVTWWLGPGLGVAFVARLVLPRTGAVRTDRRAANG